MEKEENYSDIREGNISLVLDSYEAIFSDFDPRPYTERGLSDDFLFECKKAVTSRGGVTELRLLIPAHLRKPHEEAKIKKRLKDYFRKHLKDKEKETKLIKTKGAIWFIFGTLAMLISTLVYEYKFFYDFNKFLYYFIFVISQPAGWFFFWEGLGGIFIESRKNLPDYEFFKKISSANIYFLNY